MTAVRTTLLVTTAFLALAACRDDGSSPQAAYVAVAPVEDLPLAPEAGDLRVGAPAPVGRLTSGRQGYAWAERAYAVDNAFYGTPPDYGFAYDQVEPWAWESPDHWAMYAEPVAAGIATTIMSPARIIPTSSAIPSMATGLMTAAGW